MENKEETQISSASSLSSKEDSGEPFEPEVVTSEVKQTSSSLPLSPLSPPSTSTLTKSGNISKQEKQPAVVASPGASCDLKDTEKTKEPK